MSSAVRDFLEVDKQPIDGLSEAELASEVEGWRFVFGLLPREVIENMARLYGEVRLIKRNYQGGAGILLNFKMEVTEYTIGLQETGFDSIRGKRTIESKQLVIPAAAVMYAEFIEDCVDFEPSTVEAELGEQSLESEVYSNGTSKDYSAIG